MFTAMFLSPTSLKAGTMLSSTIFCQFCSERGLYICTVMDCEGLASSTLVGTGYAPGEPPEYCGFALPPESMELVAPSGLVFLICSTLASPAAMAAAAAAAPRAGPTTGIGARDAKAPCAAL